MFLPFRPNQRGKCPSLSLSSGEKGGLGNRGRSKAAWLTVPLGNGPKSQGFLLRLWVTEGMGWGEEVGTTPSSERPRQTNKAEWRQQVFLSPLVNCTGSGLGLWGVVIEWESKPLSEAQLSQDVQCPRQVVPGSRLQDIFKAGSFVKHSKKWSSDCSPGCSRPATWLHILALRPKSQLK